LTRDWRPLVDIVRTLVQLAGVGIGLRQRALAREMGNPELE